MAQLKMQEESSTPSTPSSGKWSVYPKADGLHLLEDTGSDKGVIAVNPSTSGNVLTSNGSAWVSSPPAMASNIFKNTITSIVNNGTATLTPDTNLSGMAIVIFNGSSGFRKVGQFAVDAYGEGASRLVSDTSSIYSHTATTPNKVNVYYTAANPNHITVENKTGETISNITLILLGRQF